MNELALFAGSGGGILGGRLLGWRTVCAVEVEPYPRAVLLARQRDGFLDPFPIWDDVRTFDGKPWRGYVDVVSGGFPCQDISVAGRGAGITGERSGMWTHMARIIGEVRPRFAFVENSPALLTRGLGRVLGDLAALGYDCRWTVLGAADVGAPHRRKRIWIVAHTKELQRNGREHHAGSDSESSGQIPESGNSRYDEDLAYTHSTQRKGNERPQREEQERANIGIASWWSSEPNVGRMANGVASRVDRLKATGNGQVPAVAAAAWRLLVRSTSLEAKRTP
jgi:DNA (cytosine-5)-methyltransferase 1